jgi:hypothetical protein
MKPSLQSALSWIDQNLAQFAIPSEGATFANSVRPISELAVAGDLLVRAGRADVGRRYLEHAWHALRDGQFLVDIIAQGPQNAGLAYGYAPLYRNQLRNATLDEALAARARQPGVPPLHRLTLATTLEAIGQSNPWTVSGLLEQVWAKRLHLPWSQNAIDLASTAHDVFFVSDFGRSLDQISEPELGKLEKWLPVWVHELAKNGLLELLAQMIAAWHCAMPKCVDSDAWGALHDNQAPDGSIPPEPNKGAGFLSLQAPTLYTVMALALCTHDAPSN